MMEEVDRCEREEVTQPIYLESDFWGRKEDILCHVK